jgi:hypothetical protein
VPRLSPSSGSTISLHSQVDVNSADGIPLMATTTSRREVWAKSLRNFVGKYAQKLELGAQMVFLHVGVCVALGMCVLCAWARSPCEVVQEAPARHWGMQKRCK